MFFYLSKVLYFIIQPINWVFALIILAVITKNRVKRKRLLIGGFLLLYLFSNSFIFNEFARAWELPISKQNDIEESYPVAVVLGGMIHKVEGSKDINFERTADRILQVLPLYFSGKVRKIMISGGSGSLVHNNKEADLLAGYLMKIGVKKKDLILESKSRNTYENALYTKEILDELNMNQKILLCTSAMHMRRSAACFVNLDVDVDLYVVDPVSTRRKFYPSHLIIPNAKALGEWYNLFHEWVGTLIYKMMGYC